VEKQVCRGLRSQEPGGTKKKKRANYCSRINRLRRGLRPGVRRGSPPGTGEGISKERRWGEGPRGEDLDQDGRVYRRGKPWSSIIVMKRAAGRRSKRVGRLDEKVAQKGKKC